MSRKSYQEEYIPKYGALWCDLCDWEQGKPSPLPGMKYRPIVVVKVSAPGPLKVTRITPAPVQVPKARMKIRIVNIVSWILCRKLIKITKKRMRVSKWRRYHSVGRNFCRMPLYTVAVLSSDIVLLFHTEKPLTANLFRGAYRPVVDQSRMIFSHENIQLQIKFCTRCGDYHPGYMHQEWYSNRVICTCTVESE